MQRIKLFRIPPPVEQLSILARLAFMEYVMEYKLFLCFSSDHQKNYQIIFKQLEIKSILIINHLKQMRFIDIRMFHI